MALVLREESAMVTMGVSNTCTHPILEICDESTGSGRVGLESFELVQYMRAMFIDATNGLFDVELEWRIQVGCKMWYLTLKIPTFVNNLVPRP